MRILIAEDEPEISSFVRKTLEADRYVVDVVDNGAAAVEAALAQTYDVILLDYMMPEKDGLTVTRELREKNVHSPILMLTVIDDVATIVAALDAGADDYLTKPFHTEVLVARVRALLRREKELRGAGALTVGELTLDPATFEVRRQGKLIALSRKEFMLLEYLMRHPGRPISRTEFLSHVWEASADPLTNTVDVHIRFLRRKIDKGYPVKLIRTVHGVGYMLGLPFREQIARGRSEQR